MRHRVFGRRLSRDINARKALLSNLTNAVLEKGKVTTTIAKAKFAKPYIEKLVTSAKRDRLFANRKLASFLGPVAFRRLTAEIAPGFEARSGGYLRIVRQMPRRGDNAQMATLEFLAWDKSKAKVPKVAKGPKVAKVSKAKLKRSKVATKSKSNPSKSASKSAKSNK